MFTTNIKVYFYDADPAGIIFYANLFRFTHSAYEDMMRSFELERNFFFDRDYVLPIIHAEADYIKPIKVGEIITASIVVSQLKDSSFELSYTFTGSNDDIRAKAKTVHVCVDKKSFVKSNLPQDFYDKLAANQS